MKMDAKLAEERQQAILKQEKADKDEEYLESYRKQQEQSKKLMEEFEIKKQLAKEGKLEKEDEAKPKSQDKRLKSER